MTTSTAQRTASNAGAFETFDLTVARGAAALARINAAEATYAKAVTRQDWKEVGEGLLVGRKLCPEGKSGNLVFAAWCGENGYGTMDRRERSDAMAMSESWADLTPRVSTTLTSPKRVMAAYRAAIAAPKPKATPKAHAGAAEAPAAAPPPWAQATGTPMDKRAAERAAKTLSHRPGGLGLSFAGKMSEPHSTKRVSRYPPRAPSGFPGEGTGHPTPSGGSTGLACRACLTQGGVD